MGLSRSFHTTVRASASRWVNPPHIVTKHSAQDPKATSPFLEALVDAEQAKEAELGTVFQHRVSPRAKTLITETLPAYLSTSSLESGMDDVALDYQMENTQKIIGLQTANAQGIKRYNIQTAIRMLGRSEGDTGSSEVQAAVWTVKIRDLERHFETHRKDRHNRRAYRKLIHKRARILKYLKTQDITKYHQTLKALGLKPDDVENEIVVK